MSAQFLLSLASAVLLLSSTACTISQEQGVEVARPAAPTEILTDADRQAAYNSNAGYGSGTAPDATPGRVQPGQQASSTNARQRPESLNTNLPNNTPTETRLSRLRGAPVDTLRLPQ